MSLYPIPCRVECPYDGCEAAADIQDRWTWRGIPEFVEHWALLCTAGHRYVGPVAR